MADSSLPPRRKTTIEIPLHSVRKYVPGSGPAPPRISLAPPRDSTGYIIDQFVLPTDKDMTETSRRIIHYHIGFTDLPAVKILIPCDKVLDYVSPRELEDWEYQALERKEEERAHRLAERQRASTAKKKPGRPPKVHMEDVGMPLLSSADEALLLAEDAGPSLSTPQKRKLSRVLDEEMEETSNVESDDAAIRRQLQTDGDSEGIDFEDDMEADLESVDHLTLRRDPPIIKTPSRGSSSVRPLQNLSSASSAVISTETGLTAPAPATALPPSSISTPGRIHPAWAHAFGQQNGSGKSSNSVDQTEHAKQNGTPSSLSAMSHRPKSSTSSATPGFEFKARSSSKGPSSQPSTSGIGVNSVHASNPSAAKRKSQPSGRKPPPKTQQTPKKQKVQHQVEPDAEEFEVKELLDDQWFIENGVKTHRYLVLWEGDWPEDQNPTWEPAENVQDQDLISRYRKKKKAGLLKRPKRTQKTLHQYLAGPRYSSVAEAFEGDIDEHTGPVAGSVESDVEPPNETFLVTENVGDITANGTKPARAPSFGTFDNMLARYSQTFPR